MTTTPTVLASFRPGLVWGFDFVDGMARMIEAEGPPLDAAGPAGGMRWLHVNLADQWTRRWIEAAAIPPAARELMLSTDHHQRMIVVDDAVACVVHDFERDFNAETVARIGAMSFVLTPTLMVTARQHPLCAGDIVYQRIQSGTRLTSPAAALELMINAIVEIGSRQKDALLATVQASEDALMEHNRAPDNRVLFGVRRRAVLLRRQLGGLRGVLGRLERDEDLPEALLPSVERLAQRAAALDGDVVLLDSNLRQLREEVDVQTAARTNQNLYILSILTALLLPATLVTGFFGMNTGGLPLATGGHGTWLALILSVGSSLAVYVWLARRGFFGS